MLKFIFFMLFFVGCTPTALKSSDTSNIVNNCKNVVGSTICNSKFKDENGNIQDLYQHTGKPVVIDFSVMWCAPCAAAGKNSQSIHDSNKDIDLVYITVLLENFKGEAPGKSDIKKWKIDHDVKDAPVYGGNRSLINSVPEEGYPLRAWPTFYFLDKDLTILYINEGYSKEALSYYIKDLYR